MSKGYNEAMDEIRAMSREYLYEWCHEAYKDFYGIKGRHMWNYTKEEMIHWWEVHFMWDNDEQAWRNQVPFVDEDYSKEPWYQEAYGEEA